MTSPEKQQRDQSSREKPNRRPESESPTGGPSQTPDGRPLDRDPTEEGSAGRGPSK